MVRLLTFSHSAYLAGEAILARLTWQMMIARPAGQLKATSYHATLCFLSTFTKTCGRCAEGRLTGQMALLGHPSRRTMLMDPG